MLSLTCINVEYLYLEFVILPRAVRPPTVALTNAGWGHHKERDNPTAAPKGTL